MKPKTTKIGASVSVLLAILSIISCQAGLWPDSSEKQKAISHCAQLIISSVNTNQIDLICSKMTTNLPSVIQLKNQRVPNGSITETSVANKDLVSQLKNYSERVIVNLHNCAKRLTESGLDTYSSELGYGAEVSDLQERYVFILWNQNGPLRRFDKRTTAGRILMSASFYQNGKLEKFEDNMSNGEECIFDLNGKLSGYTWTTANNVEVDVSFDSVGNVKKIRGFILD